MYYDNDALAHCFIGEDTQSAGAGHVCFYFIHQIHAFFQLGVR